MVQSATQQQRFYRSSQTATTLNCGQQVLLDNPCAGKLDPHWSGPWIVKEVKGPSSVLISKGTSERLVYVNRVRPLLMEDPDDPGVTSGWSPPLFHHENDANAHDDTPAESDSSSRSSVIVTRSGRTVRPPQRYGTSDSMGGV